MMRRLAIPIAFLALRAMAQDPACAIGGTVVDGVDNRPVPRARVMASGSYALVRLTDEHGSFCFDNVAQGEYDLTVQKPGYRESTHGVRLVVEAGSAIQPINVRIVRYAGITGSVLDSNGELLPGAQVKLWSRVRQATGWGPDEVDDTTSDSYGGFRFNQLAPGTYYLSVRQEDQDEERFAFPFVGSNGEPRREKEVETFYSGSLTFDGATPLELRAGQQADHVLLAMKKTALRRLSGRIANPPALGFLEYRSETETGADRGGAIPLAKDGRFVEVGLLPARYKLRLFDGQRPIAEKEVDLTNSDAAGVTLDPIELTDVPVVFHTEGKGPVFRPRMPDSRPAMLVRDGSDDAVGLETAKNGTYRFAGVVRGIYRLLLETASQGLYVKDIRYGGETQTGDKVDLRSVREGGLEVTFSANVAAIEGRAVLSSGDHDHNDLTMILVDAASNIAQEVPADQKGRFHMKAVPPGRYRLFAIEGFDEDEWDGPKMAKLLGEKSVDVELKESEKKQVSVTVISSGEWKAAVKM